MVSFLTTLLACPLALLSVYAGQKSYQAIINLHSDTDRAEKAAEHSDKAARELWRTRLTQASGAATVRTYMRSLLGQCFLQVVISSVLPQQSRPRKSCIDVSTWANIFCAMLLVWRHRHVPSLCANMCFHVRDLISSPGVLVAH